MHTNTIFVSWQRSGNKIDILFHYQSTEVLNCFTFFAMIRLNTPVIDTMEAIASTMWEQRRRRYGGFCAAVFGGQHGRIPNIMGKILQY